VTEAREYFQQRNHIAGNLDRVPQIITAKAGNLNPGWIAYLWGWWNPNTAISIFLTSIMGILATVAVLILMTHPSRCLHQYYDGRRLRHRRQQSTTATYVTTARA
jgi:hypothetical protein